MKRRPSRVHPGDGDRDHFSTMADLILLHTCDLHGRLTAAKAGAIRELREARPDCLLLDCGDALRGGNLSPGWSPEPVKARMNGAGYAAMAMGNRETHLWWSVLRRKLSGFRFPVLSSNLLSPRAPVRESLLLSAGGMRVGLLALTPPMVVPGTISAGLTTVLFARPLEVAAAIVGPLAEEADLVIVLSHLGRKSDRKLAKTVRGIDLILGGHDHSPGLPAGEWEGSTLLARSSPFGTDIGEVTVCRHPGIDGTRMRARLLPLPED